MLLPVASAGHLSAVFASPSEIKTGTIAIKTHWFPTHWLDAPWCFPRWWTWNFKGSPLKSQNTPRYWKGCTKRKYTKILGWFLKYIKIHQGKKYTKTLTLIPKIHQNKKNTPLDSSILEGLFVPSPTNQVTFACLHGPKARFDACWIRVTPSTGDATASVTCVTLGSFAWFFWKQTTGSLRETRDPRKVCSFKVYTCNLIYTSYNFKVELIMELQCFFCRVSFQTQNPNPQSCPEAHELRELRGSWGIFSMSQILRRIRPPDHVFQKVQM